MIIPNKLRELQEACEDEAARCYEASRSEDQFYLTGLEAVVILDDPTGYTPHKVAWAQRVHEAHLKLLAANAAFEAERERVLIEAVGEKDKELLE